MDNLLLGKKIEQTNTYNFTDDFNIKYHHNYMEIICTNKSCNYEGVSIEMDSAGYIISIDELKY